MTPETNSPAAPQIHRNGRDLPAAQRPSVLAAVALSELVICPLATLRAARLLAERVLAGQGDGAEPDLIQLQHDLSTLEALHARDYRAD